MYAHNSVFSLYVDGFQIIIKVIEIVWIVLHLTCHINWPYLRIYYFLQTLNSLPSYPRIFTRTIHFKGRELAQFHASFTILCTNNPGTFCLSFPVVIRDSEFISSSLLMLSIQASSILKRNRDKTKSPAPEPFWIPCYRASRQGLSLLLHFPVKSSTQQSLASALPNHGVCS